MCGTESKEFCMKSPVAEVEMCTHTDTTFKYRFSVFKKQIVFIYVLSNGC